MKKALGVLFFILAGAASLHAQDSLSLESFLHAKKWTLSGYATSLTNYSVNKVIDHQSLLQLFQSRLNFRWTISPNWGFSTEWRNRLYIGKLVEEQPNLNWLRNNREFLNLQKCWWKSGQGVFHTNIERLLLAWHSHQWSARVGRQRINWGMTAVWNPNDIFNSYNFLDVDYEERPGADAIQISHKTGELSSLELALAGTTSGKAISSMRYFFNRRNYDWQLLGGIYLGSPCLGMGWAGKIGEAGFKGEIQYYFRRNLIASRLNATVEWDYLTKNNWYWMGGLLLNSQGINKSVLDWSHISFELSPENMMPGKWSLIVSGRKQWQQLWTGAISCVYSPGMQLFMFLPSVSYSVSDRIDLDLTGQFYVGKRNGRLHSISQTLFLRVKYSF